MITRSRSLPSWSLPFVLLCGFLGVLWIAGGASRGDALGQPLVRIAAGLVLVLLILFEDRPRPGRGKPIWLLLGASVVVTLLQLVPLPPEVWLSLPGRERFAGAGTLDTNGQPWRPLSIVPGATANALGSLLVPAATLFLIASLRSEQRRLLPGLILILLIASTFLGLLQVSGATLNNPLINDTPGVISSSFANRNHFALFLVLGCMIAPVWAFSADGKVGWRLPSAVGLVLIFVLTILATGSRAGIFLGAFAVGAGLLIVRQPIRRELRRRPRWVFPALVVAFAALIVSFVLISVAADRAASIERLVGVDFSADMRSRGLPIVLDMVRSYFPAGSGLGGFDPLFRAHEPFDLLKLTYYNHAHNDFLEVVLDAGLAGGVLIACALGWWGWASVRAWRSPAADGTALARLGSAMLLAIFAASVFDYPARTPMVMAVVVIAALWLAGDTGERGRNALPASGQHL